MGLVSSPNGTPYTLETTKKNTFRSVCSFILIVELCERLAFWTFQTNLALYIQKELGYEASQSSMLSSVFSSLSYVTPLIGAYFADAIWGRYTTIVNFALVYTVGLGMIVLAAWPGVQSSCLFFIGLFVFICLGTGGIKCNVVTLGADQYDPVAEENQLKSFFNWYYWMSNTGAIISTAFLAEFALNGIDGVISQAYSFPISFLVAAICFGVSITVFYAGRKRYHRVKPSDSAFVRFSRILYQGARNSRRGQFILTLLIALAGSVVMNVILVFLPDSTPVEILSFVNSFIIIVGVLGVIFYGQQADWVYSASKTNGGSWDHDEVHGAWQLLRLFPYIGFMVSFWVVYQAMNGPWINQGCQMDSRVFSSQSYNPGAWGVWNVIIILVCIPLLDWWIFPKVGQMLGNGPTAGPTALQKIGAGFVFAILAMIASALVEMERRRRPLLDLNSVCAQEGEIRPVSDMSIWFQVPQYCLLGIGEILSVIASFDLFYNQVPDDIKSACQGVNLLTTAIGGALTTMLQRIFTLAGQLPTNLNNGHQEYLYILQAVLGIVFLVMFLIVSPSFEYKRTNQRDDLEGECITYTVKSETKQES